MLFSNKKQTYSHRDVTITIQNENIQREKTIKYQLLLVKIFLGMNTLTA